MGPGLDRTHDPWIWSHTRICSQARYPLCYVAWSIFCLVRLCSMWINSEQQIPIYVVYSFAMSWCLLADVSNENVNPYFLKKNKTATKYFPKFCFLHFDSFVCLFVWFDSLRPINNLSVIKGVIFLGWTSTKLGLMFLLKDTTQWRRWGSNPRPFGLESSTLPLSHCAPFDSFENIMANGTNVPFFIIF